MPAVLSGGGGGLGCRSWRLRRGDSAALVPPLGWRPVPQRARLGARTSGQAGELGYRGAGGPSVLPCDKPRGPTQLSVRNTVLTPVPVSSALGKHFTSKNPRRWAVVDLAPFSTEEKSAFGCPDPHSEPGSRGSCCPGRGLGTGRAPLGAGGQLPAGQQEKGEAAEPRSWKAQAP